MMTSIVAILFLFFGIWTFDMERKQIKDDKTV